MANPDMFYQVYSRTDRVTHASRSKNGAVFCGRGPQSDDYSRRLSNGDLKGKGMCPRCKEAVSALIGRG